MTSGTADDEGEICAARVVPDFLPLPDQLVLRGEGVKVTLTLGRRSVDFFKRETERRHVPYERMSDLLPRRYASR